MKKEKYQWSGSNDPLVLVVTEPLDDQAIYEQVLKREGIRALSLPSGLHAQQHLEHDRVAVLVADKELPGIDGFDLLVLARERWPWVKRVLMAKRPSGELVMKTRVRADARVLTKTVLPSVLLRVVREELSAYAAENTRPR